MCFDDGDISCRQYEEYMDFKASNYFWNWCGGYCSSEVRFYKAKQSICHYLFFPFVSMLDMGIYEIFNITPLAAKNTIFES